MWSPLSWPPANSAVWRPKYRRFDDTLMVAFILRRAVASVPGRAIWCRGGGSVTTAGRDRPNTDGSRVRREANDAAQIPLDGPVPPLLALQQTAGNAAVSRLVARSQLLRDDAASGTAATSGAAAPAAAGANPVLEMAKIAWDKGVTQREQDTANKLQQPQAGKPELTDAVAQLTEAMGAADSIGTQVGALDPARKTRVRRSLQRDPRIKEHGRGCVGATLPPRSGSTSPPTSDRRSRRSAT